MTLQGRKTELSVLNVLLCGMVIFVHLLSDAVTRLPTGSGSWLAAFIPWKLAASAMYGFFFISALKLFLTQPEPFDLKGFYLRRLKVVAGPYALAVVVYAAGYLALGYPFSWRAAASYLFLGTGAAHFYFVIIILQFYLLMPLWRRMVRRLDGAVMIPATLLLSLAFKPCLELFLGDLLPQWAYTYQDRFFITYLPVWVAGCYAGADYAGFLALLRRCRWVILAGVAIFGVLNTWAEYLQTCYHVWTTAIGDLGYGYELFAVLALYLLALALAGTRLPEGKLFLPIDRASYLIYLYHMLVLLAMNFVFYRLELNSVALRFAVGAVVVPCVTLAGCLAWQSLYKKVRVRLAGGRTTK